MQRQNHNFKLPSSFQATERFVKKVRTKNIGATQRHCLVPFRLGGRIINKYFLFLSLLTSKIQSSLWPYGRMEFEFALPFLFRIQEIVKASSQTTNLVTSQSHKIIQQWMNQLFLQDSSLSLFSNRIYRFVNSVPLFLNAKMIPDRIMEQRSETNLYHLLASMIKPERDDLIQREGLTQKWILFSNRAGFSARMQELYFSYLIWASEKKDIAPLKWYPPMSASFSARVRKLSRMKEKPFPSMTGVSGGSDIIHLTGSSPLLFSIFKQSGVLRGTQEMLLPSMPRITRARDDIQRENLIASQNWFLGRIRSSSRLDARIFQGSFAPLNVSYFFPHSSYPLKETDSNQLLFDTAQLGCVLNGDVKPLNISHLFKSVKSGEYLESKPVSRLPNGTVARVSIMDYLRHPLIEEIKAKKANLHFSKIAEQQQDISYPKTTMGINALPWSQLINLKREGLFKYNFISNFNTLTEIQKKVNELQYRDEKKVTSPGEQKPGIDFELAHPMIANTKNLQPADTTLSRQFSDGIQPIQLARPADIAELPPGSPFASMDVNNLAEEVCTIIEKKLRVERERRGIFT